MKKAIISLAIIACCLAAVSCKNCCKNKAAETECTECCAEETKASCSDCTKCCCDSTKCADCDSTKCCGECQKAE